MTSARNNVPVESKEFQGHILETFQYLEIREIKKNPAKVTEKQWTT